MDSAVIPVFNIFFLNKVVVGPVNNALCLLHSESTCMNSTVTIHTRWKRKKKRKSETKNVDAQYTKCNSCTVSPCESIVQLLFIRAEKKKKREKETWNWKCRGVISQMKTARSHVNFFARRCSVSVQPYLKPKFINFLKWTINKCHNNTH